jgi:hypothetical protein
MAKLPALAVLRPSGVTKVALAVVGMRHGLCKSRRDASAKLLGRVVASSREGEGLVDIGLALVAVARVDRVPAPVPLRQSASLPCSAYTTHAGSAGPAERGKGKVAHRAKLAHGPRDGCRSGASVPASASAGSCSGGVAVLLRARHAALLLLLLAGRPVLLLLLLGGLSLCELGRLELHVLEALHEVLLLLPEGLVLGLEGILLRHEALSACSGVSSAGSEGRKVGLRVGLGVEARSAVVD